MGCYVLRREAIRPFVAPGQYLDMPDLMRAMVAGGKHVHCHAPECRWLDIGRPDDYANAQELFLTSREVFLPLAGL